MVARAQIALLQSCVQGDLEIPVRDLFRIERQLKDLIRPNRGLRTKAAIGMTLIAVAVCLLLVPLPILLPRSLTMLGFMAAALLIPLLLHLLWLPLHRHLFREVIWRALHDCGYAVCSHCGCALEEFHSTCSSCSCQARP